MRNHMARLCVVAALVALLSGCGAMRSLTTKRISFGPYNAADQTFASPVAGTMVVTSSFEITGDVISKFDKYNGGIDWAGISYLAQATQPAPDINIKFYISTTAPVGAPPNVQVPAGSALIDEINLSALSPTASKNADADHNAALAHVIDAALRAGSGGNQTIYVYFQASTSGPGSMSITGISVKGVAHGSLF